MSNIDLFEPSFLQLDRSAQRSALEALIFASEEALSIKTLYGLLVSAEDADSTDEPSSTDANNPEQTAEQSHEQSSEQSSEEIKAQVSLPQQTSTDSLS